MVSNMGYANLFQQAGIISDTDSAFSAISTNSGGSWFSTQLFYSEPFYHNTVDLGPEALYNFVIDWMQSYYNYQNEMTQHPECDPFKNLTNIFPALEELEMLCNIFVGT